MGTPHHLALALLALHLVGCDGSLGSPTDARVDEDAGVAAMDAAAGVDAATGADAGAVDAAAMDAAAPVDAGSDASASADAGWGSCMLGEAMGTCMDVADCAPPASMPVMGLCPGPTEIQCCLPRSMPGTATPADVIARLGSCTRIGGDYARDVGGTSNVPICQTDSVIWWDADFDVDCDGGRGAICMSDPDYLPDTSGVDSMGRPLDASTLPFIVIPLASSRFRYADYGIRTGQVALVLYRDRMVFGIFGDAGPAAIIGEGSFAMAEALGIPSNPRTGGVDSGVTYLVFTGAGTRVTRNEDHDEAVRIGQALLDAFLAP
ncbi:MAG: glycoside hydrolase family 75 protein [Sandaracinaceae bacterium]|nr:glycoside hydrolase family 75 protein [Sandaracinaceae bacterium]